VPGVVRGAAVRVYIEQEFLKWLQTQLHTVGAGLKGT
jgi:hypothetical protein